MIVLFLFHPPLFPFVLLQHACMLQVTNSAVKCSLTVQWTSRRLSLRCWMLLIPPPFVSEGTAKLSKLAFYGKGNQYLEESSSGRYFQHYNRTKPYLMWECSSHWLSVLAVTTRKGVSPPQNDTLVLFPQYFPIHTSILLMLLFPSISLQSWLFIYMMCCCLQESSSRRSPHFLLCYISHDYYLFISP